MTKKILHIAAYANFIPPFINIVKEEFDFEEHEFLLTDGVEGSELINEKNVKLFVAKTIYSKLSYYIKVIIKMHRADNIILQLI